VPAGAGQVAAVGGGGEAAVGDPDHPGQGPVPQGGFDLADECGVDGVARPAPHPHRDPVAGDGHADHYLGQVVAVVLGLAVAAEPRRLGRFTARLGLGCDIGVQHPAALVAGHRLVLFIQLKVGGGGVEEQEEQQVDLEVEQVGHGSTSWALALALLLVAVVCAGAWVFGRRPGDWQAPAP
jgi:hypothetical protein